MSTDQKSKDRERITRVETKLNYIEEQTEENSDKLDRIETKLDNFDGATTISWKVVTVVASLFSVSTLGLIGLVI